MDVNLLSTCPLRDGFTKEGNPQERVKIQWNMYIYTSDSILKKALLSLEPF